MTYAEKLWISSGKDACAELYRIETEIRGMVLAPFGVGDEIALHTWQWLLCCVQ